jgi:rare lipoprotein A
MQFELARVSSRRRLVLACTFSLFAMGCAVGGAKSRGPAHSAAVSTSRAHRESSRQTGTAANPLDPNVEFAQLKDRFENHSVLDRHGGLASYYADSLSGNRMANGQPYDPRQPVMAHRTLPFGAVVRVVRVSNGDSVIVRVADRGPFGSRRRIADLSREAARRLGMIRDGVVEVRIEVLDLAGDH